MEWACCVSVLCVFVCVLFFVQAEDGIRVLVRSRGRGDVYKRQGEDQPVAHGPQLARQEAVAGHQRNDAREAGVAGVCLLYTSDAADERSSVDLGGRRIIKKKNTS